MIFGIIYIIGAICCYLFAKYTHYKTYNYYTIEDRWTNIFCSFFAWPIFIIILFFIWLFNISFKIAFKSEFIKPIDWNKKAKW